MDDQPTIDYWADRDTLHPAIRAAVEFLAQDHNWVRALHRHVPDLYGLCALHPAEWPCSTWHLADAARRALSLPALPAPRTSGHDIREVPAQP